MCARERLRQEDAVYVARAQQNHSSNSTEFEEWFSQWLHLSLTLHPFVAEFGSFQMG